VAAGTCRETWAKFPSRKTKVKLPLFRPMADQRGNLYMPVCNQDAKWGVGRYDVENGKFEAAPVSPLSVEWKGKTVTHPWICAVRTDAVTAYVTVGFPHRFILTFGLRRLRLADWPDVKFEDLGPLDPAGSSPHTTSR